MLKIDRQQTIEGVTVYGDDERPQLFYLLPSNLSFRIDDNGKPVFKFVKYRFPIDREDGRKGGGFVFFDVALEVPAAKEQKIRQQLQGGLDALYQSQPLPPLLAPLLGGWAGRGGETPPVELGSITFTRGTCDFLLSDTSGALIQKVTGAGKPSLFGRNIAAFMVEFTRKGRRCSSRRSRARGAAPLQVVYDPGCSSRSSPRATARAWFEGREVLLVRADRHIDWEDVRRRRVRREDHRGRLVEAHETMGVELNVQLRDPGRSRCHRRELKQKIRESMMERSLQDAVLASHGPQTSRRCRRTIAGCRRGTSSISRSDSRPRGSRRVRAGVPGELGGIEWNIVPRAPCRTSPTCGRERGESPFAGADHATEVDLNDPFFARLHVKVGVNADFGSLPIHSIEVKLKYKHVKPAQGRGVLVLRPRTTSADFETFIDAGHKEYTYVYQVNYRGSSKTF